MRWGRYWIFLMPCQMVWMRCSGVVQAVLDSQSAPEVVEGSPGAGRAARAPAPERTVKVVCAAP
jgi:hypothetical protein